MGYHQSLLRPEVPTAVKNHPIISRNSLIFILRYVMANKSDDALGIDIGVCGMLLDELAARLHIVAHQH